MILSTETRKPLEEEEASRGTHFPATQSTTAGTGGSMGPGDGSVTRSELDILSHSVSRYLDTINWSTQ